MGFRQECLEAEAAFTGSGTVAGAIPRVMKSMVPYSESKQREIRTYISTYIHLHICSMRIDR